MVFLAAALEAARASAASFFDPRVSLDLDQRSGLRGAERSCDASYEVSRGVIDLRPPVWDGLFFDPLRFL